MGLRSTRWSVAGVVGALALGVGACGGDDDERRRRPATAAARQAAEDRRLAAADRRVLRARQGGQAGLQGLGGDGQREGRPARPQGRARDQGRRVQPEHGRLRLQRADQPGQGRPAARHVLLAAQPAGLARSPSATQMLYVEPAGGSPDIFNRGFKNVFFAQQATADHQGDVWANWIAGAAGGQAARRRPPTRRSTTRSRSRPSEGIEAILKAAGIETVYRKTYTADTTNFDSIANAIKAQEPRPRRRRREFEDGVGFDPRARQGRLHARSGSTRPTRRRSATSTSKGIGEENTEGVFYAVSHSQESKTPGNPEFVAKYQEMFGGEHRARGRGRRLRGGAGPAGRGRGASARSTTSSSSPTGCARTRSPTILGPLSWNEDGSPKGEFLVGQWQNGKPEIVLPRGRRDVGRRSSEGWQAGGAKWAPSRRVTAVRPDAHPRPPGRRRLRAAGVGPDADLRRHARDQHRARRVPDPGGVRDLLDLDARPGSTRWSRS